MTFELDPDALGPLSSLASDSSEPEIRLAALEAANRFRLTEESWREVAQLARDFISSQPPGSQARRDAVVLLARIPLLSVRRALRQMAVNPGVPDRDAAASALDDIGDLSRIRPLLERARSGHSESFEKLARMPVESEGVAPSDIPPLPEAAVADARLWRALLLARLGEFAGLAAIFQGPGSEPEIFWGDPWSAYNAIASMRPVPEAMRAYLLDAVQRLGDSDRGRMVKLIAWGATGTADAEGHPIVEQERAATTIPATPAPHLVKEAKVVARKVSKRLFDQDVSSEEIELLRHLSPKRFAALVTEIVTEANKRARSLDRMVPAPIVLGNEVVDAISSRAPTAEWPVGTLANVQVRAASPALDDGQMAWLLSLSPPERLIQQLAREAKRRRPLEQRLRLLKLAAGAADYQAGRGGSPARGAGPASAPADTGSFPLINDLPEVAARAPRASPPTSEADLPPLLDAEFGRRPRLPSAPAGGGEGAEATPAARRRWRLRLPRATATPQPEERRVHAQVRHQGKSRRTFIAGAENVIRCWIGLPEPERGAFASQPIPQVEIPPEGLPLTVELCWGDQSDSGMLVLPAERTARTGDCDLRVHVPPGEHYVCAEIAFRFRGRVFEVVQVGAFAIAPGEQEQSIHKVDVRVQLRRREVLELPQSGEYGATMIWGGEPPRPGENAASSSLRVFGGQGGKRFDLKDADVAVNWLNAELFATEKSLVRRRAAQGGAEAVLDKDDDEVLALLRTIARHGANLYNQLREQGFEDPGERIQVLNREPEAYVPIEFVYDRGYPADDAKLCGGWLKALEGDRLECPTCGAAKLTDEQRTWTATMCPLGFWSLQKIIERLDPTADGRDSTTHPPVPVLERRNLPIIDSAVFASSDNVPDDERQNTWLTLQQTFSAAVLAEDWGKWKKAVKRHPPLLLLLPHHDVEAQLDYLQIGAATLPPRLGRLSRGQLTHVYINPKRREPGPIVLLLGCRTGAQIGNGYVQLARRFQQLHTSIVLGTLSEILGRHAAPLARELVAQLVAVSDAEADFGTIMRRVRRRMLAKGYLMSLCLVALGDAEWRLTPRLPVGNPA